jgi:hypothetical protein
MVVENRAEANLQKKLSSIPASKLYALPGEQ